MKCQLTVCVCDWVTVLVLASHHQQQAGTVRVKEGSIQLCGGTYMSIAQSMHVLFRYHIHVHWIHYGHIIIIIFCVMVLHVHIHVGKCKTKWQSQ